MRQTVPLAAVSLHPSCPAKLQRRATISGKITDFTTALFKTEIPAAETPVLVDFWGPGCPPCRMLAPVLEELATEFDGKLHIAKVNVADEYDVAVEFGVRSLPTLIVFKQGNPVETIVGLQSKAALKAKLAAHGVN